MKVGVGDTIERTKKWNLKWGLRMSGKFIVHHKQSSFCLSSLEHIYIYIYNRAFYIDDLLIHNAKQYAMRFGVHQRVNVRNSACGPFWLPSAYLKRKALQVPLL